MKMLILSSLLLLFLGGCQIPEMIEIINKTPADLHLSIKWKDITKTPMSSVVKSRSGEESSLVLLGKSGIWKEAEIRKYVNGIKEFRIETVNDTVALNNDVDIFSFLQGHKSRMKGNMIRIVMR
jgi:hypothetical protein